MADVARLAGVSPMTVSRAFKRDASVSDATRSSILEAADSLGYVFDSTASNLRSQRTDFVAVTIPSINNANFADTVRGLSEGLKERGLQILLGYTDYDIHEEERLIEQLLRRRPEAIVVTGGRHTPRARRLLENAGIPVIETWDLPDHPVGHVVGFSNAERCAPWSITSCRSASPASPLSAATRSRHPRHRPPRRVHCRHARPWPRRRSADCRWYPANLHEGGRRGHGSAARYAAGHPGVICVSDLSAFGALTECQRRGLRVPEQIAAPVSAITKSRQSVFRR